MILRILTAARLPGCHQQTKHVRNREENLSHATLHHDNGHEVVDSEACGAERLAEGMCG